jgi:hypothetical protein
MLDEPLLFIRALGNFKQICVIWSIYPNRNSNNNEIVFHSRNKRNSKS